MKHKNNNITKSITKQKHFVFNILKIYVKQQLCLLRLSECFLQISQVEDPTV